MNSDEVMNQLEQLLNPAACHLQLVVPFRTRMGLRELVTSLLDENEKLRALVKQVADTDHLPVDYHSTESTYSGTRLSQLIVQAQKALEDE